MRDLASHIMSRTTQSNKLITEMECDATASPICLFAFMATLAFRLKQTPTSINVGPLQSRRRLRLMDVKVHQESLLSFRIRNENWFSYQQCFGASVDTHSTDIFQNGNPTWPQMGFCCSHSISRSGLGWVRRLRNRFFHPQTGRKDEVVDDDGGERARVVVVARRAHKWKQDVARAPENGKSHGTFASHTSRPLICEKRDVYQSQSGVYIGR